MPDIKLNSVLLALEADSLPTATEPLVILTILFLGTPGLSVHFRH